MDNFSSLLKNYLIELKSLYEESVRTGEMTPELSYRPLLDRFFGDITSLINPEIKRTFEPKKQENSGRPDWRFHNSENLGVYGYVEAKGLDTSRNLTISQYQKQIESYQDLGHKILLTDGLDFIFIYPEAQKPKQISLVSKPLGVRWTLSESGLLLENELRLFFKELSARVVTEIQLITESAMRAKALSKNIKELADAPLGSGIDNLENRTIQYLHELKNLVENHHDPMLNSASIFAGFVSQVLIFGLIYAHRVVSKPEDTPLKRYSKIKNFWADLVNKNYTENLRPFKALVFTLEDELSRLGPIGTWYEDCCLLLAHINLTQIQSETPDYHKLFETFLSIFDPQTRFDYGAFFTPEELAKFTVKVCEEVTENEFEQIELYDNKNKLIDPCCGTGSFLEKLVISSSAISKMPSIIGFEILPGPYALAHYRMSMIAEEYPKNTKIVLTNTLSDSLENSEDDDLTKINLISQEQAIARKMAKPPLTLIIGNPPSSDSQNHSIGEGFEIIQEMLNDFRPPSIKRTTRQNVQKQLQNEFVKFLRWSTNKLLLSNNGVLALIMPSSFAENPSYKYARKWLLDHFSKFWILDIDLDGRTGVRSSSLFHTLQGRLLLIAVINQQQTSNRKIYHHSISELSKNEKIKYLGSNDKKLSGFKEFEIDESTYALRPKKPFNRDLYNKFWNLYADGEEGRYIFKRHCSGIKLAPSSLFVHISKPILKRRSSKIADLEIPANDIISNWYQGQDRPPNTTKFTEGVRREIGNALGGSQSSIFDYSFRPFLTIPALISETVLQELTQAPGGGTRYRPEVISAFKFPETIGIAIAPSTKELGESLHRFASFCWALPDNDLCKRGNSHIFCNVFPEYKRTRRSWNPNPVANINTELLERLGISDPKDIVFYVYGVLCSDVYLDEFEGALFTMSNSDTWPKIPVPSNLSKFKKIAEYGKKLAENEKSVSMSEMELKQPFSDFKSLHLSEFQLTRFFIKPEEESLTLIGNNNTELEIKPIAREILEFQVAGYQVLQQWLKMYSYVYSRSNFTYENYTNLLYLLQSISNQINIIRNIDREVTELINDDDQLLS